MKNDGNNQLDQHGIGAVGILIVIIFVLTLCGGAYALSKVLHKNKAHNLTDTVETAD